MSISEQQRVKKLQGAVADWNDKLQQAESKYNFQKNLTEKLDNHHGDFSETTLLEIILWKTNRYPEISKTLLEQINDLRRQYTKEKAKNLLHQLISLKGFDLPMASTVLRFACPHEFQIIDQRVYRLITDEDELKLPYQIDDKINLYFKYIQDLKTICNRYNIPFNKADRILYQIDKMENKRIPIKY